MEKIWMHEMTWKEVESYLEDKDTVLVPIGSTEQHGPHLPTGTDTFEGIYCAEEAAKRTGTMVIPPVWFGDSNHHLAFPGTISLRPGTLVELLKDIYNSLIHQGFRKIITVNGHRLANIPAVEFASKEVKESHPEVFFAIIDPLKIGCEVHRELREGGEEDGIHGGEFETSFIMYRFPDLLDEKEMVKESHKAVSRFTSKDPFSAKDVVIIPTTWQDKKKATRLGHDGDPTLASREKGEKVYTKVVDNIVEFLEEIGNGN